MLDLKWAVGSCCRAESRVLIRSDNTTVVPEGEGRKALRIESKTSAPTWSGGELGEPGGEGTCPCPGLAFPVANRIQ